MAHFQSGVRIIFLAESPTLPRDSEIFADHREFVMDKGVARIPDARTNDNEGRTRHGDRGSRARWPITRARSLRASMAIAWRRSCSDEWIKAL
jgi:hypothetical protein